MLIHEVRIPAGRFELEGVLSVPTDASGIVIFAHGVGSSRHSPRNKYVALRLNTGGVATLLIDLLTFEEERDELTHPMYTDIGLLSNRLVQATDWVSHDVRCKHLPLGYFGASTGAAAALTAAAQLGRSIKAIVTRSGRPDLALDMLHKVTSPTLLIVGQLDTEALRINRQAIAHLTCKKDLQMVPRARHLFEEPGALDAVAKMAKDWFVLHFEISALVRASS